MENSKCHCVVSLNVEKQTWGNSFCIKFLPCIHANKEKKDLLTDWPCCSVYCNTLTHKQWKETLLVFKPHTHSLCEATCWVSPLALLPLFHPSLLSKIFALHLLTSLVLLPFLFTPLHSHRPHPPLLPLVWTSRLCLLSFQLPGPLAECALSTQNQSLWQSQNI